MAKTNETSEKRLDVDETLAAEQDLWLEAMGSEDEEREVEYSWKRDAAKEVAFKTARAIKASIWSKLNTTNVDDLAEIFKQIVDLAASKTVVQGVSGDEVYKTFSFAGLKETLDLVKKGEGEGHAYHLLDMISRVKNRLLIKKVSKGKAEFWTGQTVFVINGLFEQLLRSYSGTELTLKAVTARMYPVYTGFANKLIRTFGSLTGTYDQRHKLGITHGEKITKAVKAVCDKLLSAMWNDVGTE
jgi:hypothetical protein